MSTFPRISGYRYFLAIFIAGAAFWGVGASILSAADQASESLNIALNYYNERQDDRAISEFKRYLTANPNHAERSKADFYLAQCLIRKEKYDEAFIYLDDILGKQLSAIKVVPKESFFDANYYKTNIQPKMASAHSQTYGRQALFRAGEIAYQQGDLENGRRYLYAFLTEFSDDPFNAWTLPYLGDIAKQNYDYSISEGYNSVARTYAEEAEYYFGAASDVYPDGDFYKESQFGLGWAKSRLGKYVDAAQIFRQLAFEPNGSQTENAYYEWGLMYYEQGNYEQAISTLTNFERQYPSSDFRNDSIRVRAKSLAGLEKYQEALKLISQISGPTVEDYLLNVRCLFGLKQYDEASKLLASLDQDPRSQSVKDEIQLLQAVQAMVNNDRNKTISILEILLRNKYDSKTRQMTFAYFDPPERRRRGSSYGADDSTGEVSIRGKLSEEKFLKACAILCVGYALVGRTDESNATVNAMNQFAKPDDVRQTHIIDNTMDYLGRIASGDFSGSQGDPGYAGGDLIPIDPSRDGGIDFGPVIDDKDLVPAGGSFDPNRRGNRGNRGGSDSGTSQDPADRYAGNTGDNRDNKPGNPSGSGSGRNPGNKDNRNSSQNSQDYRRTLQACRSLIQKNQWDEADRKLLALLGNNPPDSIGAEAALMRCQVCLELGNESEAEVMSDLILNTYHNTIQYGDALWISGDYYEKRGDTEKALEQFKILADDYSNNSHADGALFHLAWDDLENGSKQNARRKFKKINTTYRDGDYWSHGTWGLAYLAYEDKNYDEAEKYVQELLNHPPDQAVLDRVLFLKGKLAEKRDDWAVAETAYKTLAKFCPDSSLLKSANTQAAIARSRMNENR